jgi:hypothetical protein
MGTITDLSDILYTLTSGGSGNVQTIFINKKNANYSNSLSGNLGAGYFQPGWSSLFLISGAPGIPTVLPSTVTACTNTTDGGMKQQNPPSGKQQWLWNWTVNTSRGTTSPMFMLYDRLIHMGGLSAAATTLQTINLTGLTRYSSTTTCVGNRILVEVLASIGTTQRTLTVIYTNQDGVSGRTSTVLWGGSGGQASIGSAQIVPLVSGDTGVKSVESVQLNGSTGSAGNYGVSIIRPLDYCGSLLSVSQQNDLMNGIPTLNVEILPQACLCLLIHFGFASSSSAQGLETTIGYICLVNK